MKEAYAIIGMQYGSEAKGALAGYLAYNNRPDTVMSNWSPNAGHTFQNGDMKLVRRQIPIGTVSPSIRTVLIGPGSIIDEEVFYEEWGDISKHINVIVHPHAAIVNPGHVAAEERDYIDGWSTKKGAGEAAVERMRRIPGSQNIASRSQMLMHNDILVSMEAYHDALSQADIIQMEGCQGFSLSMYSGFYPFTTSRDTTIHQLKADLAWHGHIEPKVYGAVRTFPIRIADDSGPCYPDQEEVSWDNWPGLEPEITTVTKKVRRIFSFSKTQIRHACLVNNPDAVYLSFCDYPEFEKLESIRNFIQNECGMPIRWQSWGPDLSNMREFDVQKRRES